LRVGANTATASTTNISVATATSNQAHRYYRSGRWPSGATLKNRRHPFNPFRSTPLGANGRLVAFGELGLQKLQGYLRNSQATTMLAYSAFLTTYRERFA
jgi:hypothetical protein